MATGRLPDLVAELVPIAAVPELESKHRVAQVAKRIAFNDPWSEAVLRVLETRAYAEAVHRPGSIAARLHITLAEEQRSLALLEQAELVRFDGRRYLELRRLTVDTRGDKRAQDRLKQHWASVAAARAAQPVAGDVFAYNVLSVAEPDLERIRELLHRTYREIRSIVAASEPAESVALLNLHLVGWNRA